MTPSEELSLQRLAEFRALFRKYHQEGMHTEADVILQQAQIFPSDRNLAALFPSGIRDKLFAYGREWEIKMMAAALRENCRVYGIGLRIRISELAPFQRMLEERLGDGKVGVMLFAENNVEAGGISGEVWNSIWYLALRDGTDPESLGIGKYTGVLGEARNFLIT